MTWLNWHKSLVNSRDTFFECRITGMINKNIGRQRIVLQVKEMKRINNKDQLESVGTEKQTWYY